MKRQSVLQQYYCWVCHHETRHRPTAFHPMYRSSPSMLNQPMQTHSPNYQNNAYWMFLMFSHGHQSPNTDSIMFCNGRLSAAATYRLWATRWKTGN